jgi:hypothetical protein
MNLKGVRIRGRLDLGVWILGPQASRLPGNAKSDYRNKQARRLRSQGRAFASEGT